MKKMLLISLLTTDAFACSAYLELARESETYKIINVSQYNKQEPNILVANYYKTYSGKYEWELSPAGKCSGDFNDVPFNKSYAAFMLTMGVMGKQISKCEINKDNLEIARNTSNFMNNKQVLSIINECLVRESAEEQSRLERELEKANKISSLQSSVKVLKPGDEVNCGEVIAINGPMVHVQTGSDARDIWINKKYIYPKLANGATVGCRDGSRWYKRYGNWVQGGGLEFYQNNNSYTYFDEVYAH